MPLAPIALFIFKRPEETRQTLEHLARNPGIEDSELFVFCDAAKTPNETAAVQAVRKVVRSRVWCPRTTVVEHAENWGLARSVMAGVNQLTASHGRVIVLEDDLLLARGTLRYFNEALLRYAGEERVMQISGHTFSVPAFGDPYTSFFIPLTTSWGWATWLRAWQHFDTEADGWEQLKTDAGLRSRFNMDNSYSYAEMLENQKGAKCDSWGIYWRWCMFRREALSLYPTRTLVKNIGFGQEATHTKYRSKWMLAKDWQPDHEVRSFPREIKVDEERWAKTKQFFRKANFPSFPVRMLRLPVRILHRIQRMLTVTQR